MSGTTLESVTREVHAIRIKNQFVPNQNIVLVDTPGFDDTTRPDSTILRMIAEWLKATSVTCSSPVPERIVEL